MCILPLFPLSFFFFLQHCRINAYGFDILGNTQNLAKQQARVLWCLYSASDCQVAFVCKARAFGTDARNNIRNF